jgi:outer membrane receptor protein involved in Fe transport
MNVRRLSHARRALQSVSSKQMLRRTPLSAAVSALVASTAMPVAVLAQDAPVIEEILVTATRREENIQDIPINIASFDGNLLEAREIGDLAELGRNVPGLYVVDQGKRGANHIVVRGLNLDTITSSEALNNNGGNVVATYVGEIPLYVDLALTDMQRVEVLLGPQGTLYGAGTLGGAIRYLPHRPELGTTSLEVRGASFDLAESGDMGWRGGVTANLPLARNFALRLNLDRYDDPGFIDSPYVVREIGVSDPEPALTNSTAVAANLVRFEDTNWEDTTSGRAGLRWEPTDAISADLTYYYQDMEVGGRQQNHMQAFGTGRYQSANRVLEPNERKNRLAALELNADLGFATLTSSTGYSTYADDGQRDQTDLLITLEYFYELFPSFTAFTRDIEHDRNVSQEVRLVSQNDGPLSWIGGLFWYKQNVQILSVEYTPHYDAYLGGSRPDSIEYFAFEHDDQTERAVFGEIGYQITDQWQVTVGGRYYDYDLDIESGFDLPLANTVFGGAPPGAIDITPLANDSQSDSGSLFKVNTSYQFTDDFMGYVTISEGFRLGASNGVPACTEQDYDDIRNGVQVLCAEPDEVQFFPDTTTNYEVGVRTQWLDRKLTINGAVYYIDWSDPQLFAVTRNGALPITKNGDGAESTGLELSVSAVLTDRLTLDVGWAHTKAELSKTAPNVLRVFTPPGFGPGATYDGGAAEYTDGLPGDRLPGSPENQAAVNVSYQVPMRGEWGLELNYGFAAISDIITTIGARAGGETLGSYSTHSLSAILRHDEWTVGLYAQNLTNEYAETGVRSRPSFVQTVADENGDPVRVRSYSHEVLRPREVGLKFSYAFGDRSSAD